MELSTLERPPAHLPACVLITPSLAQSLSELHAWVREDRLLGSKARPPACASFMRSRPLRPFSQPAFPFSSAVVPRSVLISFAGLDAVAVSAHQPPPVQLADPVLALRRSSKQKKETTLLESAQNATVRCAVPLPSVGLCACLTRSALHLDPAVIKVNSKLWFEFFCIPIFPMNSKHLYRCNIWCVPPHLWAGSIPQHPGPC